MIKVLLKPVRAEKTFEMLAKVLLQKAKEEHRAKELCLVCQQIILHCGIFSECDSLLDTLLPLCESESPHVRVNSIRALEAVFKSKSFHLPGSDENIIKVRELRDAAPRNEKRFLGHLLLAMKPAPAPAPAPNPAPAPAPPALAPTTIVSGVVFHKGKTNCHNIACGFRDDVKGKCGAKKAQIMEAAAAVGVNCEWETPLTQDELFRITSQLSGESVPKRFRPAKATKFVFVGNLAMEITKQTLKGIFGGFGKLTTSDISLIRAEDMETQHAFIYFNTLGQASEAGAWMHCCYSIQSLSHIMSHRSGTYAWVGAVQKGPHSQFF